MSRIEDILLLLEAMPVTDIIVAGIAWGENEKQTVQFHPALQEVYIEFDFGKRYLRCTSIHWGSLELEIVSEIATTLYRPRANDDEEARDLELEEGEVFGTCSLYNLYFDEQYHRSGNFVVELRFFTKSGDIRTDDLIDYALLRFTDQPPLFLNPHNTFGIKMGGDEELARQLNRQARAGRHFEERVWKKPFTKYVERI